MYPKNKLVKKLFYPVARPNQQVWLEWMEACRMIKYEEFSMSKTPQQRSEALKLTSQKAPTAYVAVYFLVCLC